MTRETDVQGVGESDLPEWLDRREQALDRWQIAAGMRNIYSLVSARARREIWLLVGLMLIVSLLEAASIAALWPFLDLAGAGMGGADAMVAPESASGRILTLFGGSWREAIVASAAVVGSLALVTAVARLALAWLTQTAINHIGHELSAIIYARILRQPYALFIRRNSSEVLSGIDKVQGLVLGVFLPLLLGASSAVMVAVIAVVLLVLAPLATLIAATFMGAIYAAVILATRRRLATVSGVLSETYTARIKSMQEGLGGIRDILIDGTAPVFVEEFAKADQRFRMASVQSNVISGSPRWIVEGLGIFVLAMAAALFAVGDGGLAGALPLLGVFALAALRILPLAQNLYAARTAMASYSGLLQDVIRLTQLPQQDEQRQASVPLPFTRAIAFEDVFFRHAGVNEDVLKGLELTIPKGAHIGIMGASGSGKSTLLDLAMGLMDPTGGRILIDGAPLGPENRSAWQMGIAHVPQAIFLADASIAENIAFGQRPEAIDMAALREAARIAGLADFIESLPEAHSTRVGERGAVLSGGQRQRIGIARAVYRRPQLLVLDEATSALDEETETSVVEAITDASPGLTILFVAHRASTLRLCDRIVRVEAGRVASGRSHGAGRMAGDE
jgi:ABC-type bacteriocin/lantibiotic exporter with double-glycine peptidase domain